MKHRLYARLTALALAAVLLCGLALPAAAAYDLPFTPSAEDESIYVENLDTGEVLFSQNASERRYVASLTKSISALLLCESGVDLNTTITVPDGLTEEFKEIQNYNGADMKLKIGENIRLIDLLYGMLVPSANDAASTVAYYLAGSLDAFVQKMNDRAAALGCTNTTFTCPHGLYDQGNLSTAEDMAKIAAACFANEQFMAVANTVSYTVPADNSHTEERTLETTNPLIVEGSAYYRDTASGIKTGFTTLAGRCYMTVAQKDSHRYLIVILGAKKEGKDEASYVYSEADQIIDWIFARFSDRTLLDANTAAATVPLRGCSEADSIALYPAQSVTQYAYADAVVEVKPTVPEAVKAPVKAGDVEGSAAVYLDGTLVQTVDLVAKEDYASALLRGSLNALMLVPVLLVALMVLSVLTVAAGARRRGRAPRAPKPPRTPQA